MFNKCYCNLLQGFGYYCFKKYILNHLNPRIIRMSETLVATAEQSDNKLSRSFFSRQAQIRKSANNVRIADTAISRLKRARSWKIHENFLFFFLDILSRGWVEYWRYFEGVLKYLDWAVSKVSWDCEIDLKSALKMEISYSISFGFYVFKYEIIYEIEKLFLHSI